MNEPASWRCRSLKRFKEFDGTFVLEESFPREGLTVPYQSNLFRFSIRSMNREINGSNLIVGQFR
jgi:hypothetical protein